MVLIPWRCYEDLSCFAQEMNQLFDRFFGRELIDRPWENLSYPPLQITEMENEVLVHLKTQDFSPEDLEITFKENVLVINGKKKKKEDIKNKEIHYSQRRIDSFQRTIRVQTRIQADAIDAKYRDGILIITLPKVKEKPSSVKVAIE